MPEVAGLTEFLARNLRGRTLTRLDVVAFTALKTVAVPPPSLIDSFVTGVARHGKWIDLELAAPEGERHLIFHLARAGWLRWYDQVPTVRPRPSPKSPLALRAGFDDGGGFDLTEAGTRRKLALYLVADPSEVPMIATLGPDPLAADFTDRTLAEVLQRSNVQIKRLLRDQSVIAGIGNAYSDEILHAAHLSPFAQSRGIAADAATLGRLHAAIIDTLRTAVETSSGKPAKDLKDAKRAGMAVHGRTGQACPVCGDVVREVSFADSSLQYCATCQTGGRILADRRMSRLLR